MLTKILGICFCLLFSASNASELPRMNSWPMSKDDMNKNPIVAQVDRDFCEFETQKKEEEASQSKLEGVISQRKVGKDGFVHLDSDGKTFGKQSSDDSYDSDDSESERGEGSIQHFLKKRRIYKRGRASGLFDVPHEIGTTSHFDSEKGECSEQSSSESRQDSVSSSFSSSTSSSFLNSSLEEGLLGKGTCSTHSLPTGICCVKSGEVLPRGSRSLSSSLVVLGPKNDSSNSMSSSDCGSSSSYSSEQTP